MLVKTRCIALNPVRYSDSGIIARLYSREYGRLALMVKGSGRRKGRHGIMFQPLFVLDLEIYHRQSRELQTLKEPTVSFAPHNIYSDVRKSCVAVFIGEVLASVLREESPNEALFDFIEDSVKYYDCTGEGFANFHLAFLATLSSYLGFEPSRNTAGSNSFFDMQNGCFSALPPVHGYCSDAENSSILAQIFDSSFDGVKDIALTGSRRSAVLEDLIGYYRLHLPGLTHIKSLDAMREIFG